MVDLRLNLEIVTCPSFPIIRKNYETLLSIIYGPDIERNSETKVLLQHGRLLHRFDIIVPNRQVKKQIFSLIDQILFYPVSFVISGDHTENVISALNLFVKDYMHHKYSYPFKIHQSYINNYDTQSRDVEGFTFDINQFTIFTPFIVDESGSYDQQLYLLPNDPTFTLKLEPLIKYFSIGCNPLVEYLLKDSADNSGLDHVEGVYTLPFPPELQVFNEDGKPIEEYRLDYLEQVLALQSRGYLAVKVSDSNDIDRTTYKNLCELAGIPIVYETESYIYIYVAESLQGLLNQDPLSFLQENINRIHLEKVPVITLTGSWQNYLDPRENPVLEARIYYTMCRLLERFPIMRPFIPDEVKILPNFTIRIPFTSMFEVRQIKEQFEREINKLEELFVLQVSNLVEGLHYRLKLEQLGPTGDSRSGRNEIPSPNRDLTSLSNMPNRGISLIIPSGGNLFVVSNVNPLPTANQLGRRKNNGKLRKKDANNLRKMLLNYLEKLCESDTDPVYLTKFTEMPLDELITIVRPERESPYCYTAETIQQLSDKFSPITRKPFDPWVIKLINDPTLMARGFLPLGTLPGLLHFEDLTLPDVDPVNGKLISIPSTDGKETTIVIRMNNGNLIDFAEIDTELVSEDFQLLQDLWNRGYFLNIWGVITNEYLKKLEANFLRLDPIMYLGKGTPAQVAEAINRIRFS